jgi:hypothetical protein
MRTNEVSIEISGIVATVLMTSGRGKFTGLMSRRIWQRTAARHLSSNIY